MNVAEGWNMYLEIQDLKEMHFNVSQISRRLDLSRTTVYKYLDMTLEEMEQVKTTPSFIRVTVMPYR